MDGRGTEVPWPWNGSCLFLLQCEPESPAGRNDSIDYRVNQVYRLKGLSWQVPRGTFGSVPRGGREEQAALGGLLDFRSRRSFFTRDGRGHLGRNRGDGRSRLHSLEGVLASTVDRGSLGSGIATLARRSGIATLARRSNLAGRVNRSRSATAVAAAAATPCDPRAASS